MSSMRPWCCFPAGRTPPSASPGRSSAMRASRRSASPTASATPSSSTQRALICVGAAARSYPQLGARLGDDHVLDCRRSAGISDTALTRDAEIEMTAAGLPNTFVPGRNLLFFTYAAALAYRRGIRTLVGGMCETDFSGYPDCRDDTLQALAQGDLARHGRRFVIETPLMWIDKAGTWALAEQLGGAPLVELIVEHTHTCYHGDRTHAARLGLRLRPLPGLRAARQGMGEMARPRKRADPRRGPGPRRRLGRRRTRSCSARGRRHLLLAARRAAQDRGRRRQHPLLVPPRRPSVRRLRRSQGRARRHPRAPRPLSAAADTRCWQCGPRASCRLLHCYMDCPDEPTSDCPCRRPRLAPALAEEPQVMPDH